MGGATVGSVGLLSVGFRCGAPVEVRGQSPRKLGDFYDFHSNLCNEEGKAKLARGSWSVQSLR